MPTRLGSLCQAGSRREHVVATAGRLTPPGTCKYHPSCSEYALAAFRELGLVRGAIVAGWRLLRCNPWSHGGCDHVRDRRLFRDPESPEPTT